VVGALKALALACAKTLRGLNSENFTTPLACFFSVLYSSAYGFRPNLLLFIGVIFFSGSLVQRVGASGNNDENAYAPGSRLQT